MMLEWVYLFSMLEEHNGGHAFNPYFFSKLLLNNFKTEITFIRNYKVFVKCKIYIIYIFK
jgi:hypothetical protein